MSCWLLSARVRCPGWFPLPGSMRQGVTSGSLDGPDRTHTLDTDYPQCTMPHKASWLRKKVYVVLLAFVTAMFYVFLVIGMGRMEENQGLEDTQKEAAVIESDRTRHNRLPRQDQINDKGARFSENLAFVTPTSSQTSYNFSQSACANDYRIQWMRTVCKQRGSTPQRLGKVYVDRAHLIFYCQITNSASSSIKASMAVKASKRNDVYSHGTGYAGLEWKINSTIKTMRQSLDLATYFKFTVFRHPFVRLYSFYKSKFQEEDSFFYRRRILKPFRRIIERALPGWNVTSGITFHQLVQLVVDHEDDGFVSDDWSPQTRLCDVCSANLTYAGKMETIDKDIPYFLPYLGMNELPHLTPGHQGSGEWKYRVRGLATEFRTLPVKQLQKLQEFYADDFAILGYGWKDGAPVCDMGGCC